MNRSGQPDSSLRTALNYLAVGRRDSVTIFETDDSARIEFPTRIQSKPAGLKLAKILCAGLFVSVLALVAHKEFTVAALVGAVLAIGAIFIVLYYDWQRAWRGRHDVLVISADGLGFEQHNSGLERDAYVDWDLVTSIEFVEPVDVTACRSMLQVRTVSGMYGVEIYREIECEDQILELVDRFRSRWESQFTQEERLKMKATRDRRRADHERKIGLRDPSDDKETTTSR